MLGNGKAGWEDGAIPVGCDAKLMSLFQLEISWGGFSSWALQGPAAPGQQELPCDPGGIQEAPVPLNADRSAGISTAMVSMSAQGKHSISQDTKILWIREEASRALLS